MEPEGSQERGEDKRWMTKSRESRFPLFLFEQSDFFFFLELNLGKNR